LEQLIINRQTLQARTAGSGLKAFTMQDLVNVLVLAFIAGFVFV
jgi:hypothetical protein